MPLVMLGTIIPFDGTEPRAGAVYIDGEGRVEKVQAPADPAPAGYATAARVDTGGVIYPGLVDLHNHLAYNLRSLWTPPRQQPYTTRYQWPRDASYHPQISQPTAFFHTHAPEEALKYVEVKSLVGGVTTVQGLSSSGVPSEGWLVHHTEYETLGSGHKATYQSVLQLNEAAQFDDAQRVMKAGSAFIYHLSEGTAPSLTAEFDALETHGCVLPELVAIHGTALGGQQFSQWTSKAGSLVWSPLSNLWLYRATTDVAGAHAAGIRLCIGSDWSPSGSKHVLAELKVADLWNATRLGGLFSDEQLCEMVTANPAEAIGLGKLIGRILPGARADLLVMPSKETDPYRNLIQCTERDTALVVVGGRPAYGARALMKAAGAGNLQPIGAAGLSQVISLPNPAISTAHLRWTDIVGRLQTLQQNPQGAPQALAAAPSAFRVVLDMPWDAASAPDMLAAGPPLTSVPPLDSLVHDDAFFAALGAAPILNGLLGGLRGRYYADA